MSEKRNMIFARFEDALVNLHRTLQSATAYYSQLFEKLISNEDVSQTLIDDAMFLNIQEKRTVLHQEQKRISRIISQESSDNLTLNDIHKILGDRLEVDVVRLGKESIAFYQEIERQTYIIFEYLSSRVTAYNAFFDELYQENAEMQPYRMNWQSNVLENNGGKGRKQGVLFHARV